MASLPPLPPPTVIWQTSLSEAPNIHGTWGKFRCNGARAINGNRLSNKMCASLNYSGDDPKREREREKENDKWALRIAKARTLGGRTGGHTEDTWRIHGRMRGGHKEDTSKTQGGHKGGHSDDTVRKPGGRGGHGMTQGGHEDKGAQAKVCSPNPTLKSKRPSRTSRLGNHNAVSILCFSPGVGTRLKHALPARPGALYNELQGTP